MTRYRPPGASGCLAFIHPFTIRTSCNLGPLSMDDRESSPLTGLLVVSAISSYVLVVCVAVWMLAGLPWGPVAIAIEMLAASVGLIGAGIFVWQSIRYANRRCPWNPNGLEVSLQPGHLPSAQRIARFL